MEQHFELGEFFRERYRNILPIKYNLNDIYVRSSDVDRCLQSATFNLQKFYPPIRKGNSEEITFQAVPIHTAPFQKDKYLGVIPNCNKFYIDLYKLNSTEPLQCMAEKTRAIKEYVSRECDIGQFSSIVYDTLFIEELYNLTLPKWTISVYPENLRSLSLYSQYHLMALTRTQLKYSIGPLIDEIVSLMIDKQMGQLNPDRKLFMYSGHDSQVFSLLRALRVFNGLHVPYAAAVLIELRRAGDNHVVTVSWGQKGTLRANFMV
uniref:acid phosphatase n=1 Tax=Timema bartmani TaxID=61472 RepID=A0A7R9FAI8_9NEOP|nr:unnamed protein product [Timema bartmani]